MNYVAPIVIDFETKGIERRPAYPPEPCGVSIKWPGRKSVYYGWGHLPPVAPVLPAKTAKHRGRKITLVQKTNDIDFYRKGYNNCTKEKALWELKKAYKSKLAMLFHHGKFDVDVADVHMNLPIPRWDRIHDTLYSLFLHDPHARSLSLKPSAERLLNMKPEERDELKDWICKNVPEAKKKKSEWGAYIWRAPSQIVGPYACGDTDRTEGLHRFLFPRIVKAGMLEAYDRERKLMPILLDTERRGIRADLKRMKRDRTKYQKALAKADGWLRKKLKTPKLNLDADEEVGDALFKTKMVTDWTYTPKAKKRSVAKKNMTLDKFHDKKTAMVYGYRGRLATCLSMFFEPWIRMAEASNGYIYTNWNQVRQSHGNDKFAGARTGRLSSNPNFQNIPKDFLDKDDGYEHPTALYLPPLPLMRSYLLPYEGHVWGHRDYNQQELRLLAHFEDGSLCRGYNENPRLDVHTLVQVGIKELAGLILTRSGTKIMNFGDIYGMGVGEFAARLKITVAMAKRLKEAKRKLMPDFAELDDDIKQRAKAPVKTRDGKLGIPIRTWGGRLYYCEAPAFVKKFQRVMEFGYKLLNYLIQGSAADVTKEAVIRYYHHPRRKAIFVLTVHDELNISIPKHLVKREMAILREVMESITCGVPMLSDGKTGPNWGALKKFEEKPYVISRPKERNTLRRRYRSVVKPRIHINNGSRKPILKAAAVAAG